jgi:hypothetical protein
MWLIFYAFARRFFQTVGENKISIGKISSRPSSIAKDNTSFA